MGFDFYAFRRSHVGDLPAAREYLEADVIHARDPQFQHPIADSLEASGWERFIMDYDEVAGILHITRDEAEARFSGIEFSRDDIATVLHVAAAGLEIHLPWHEEGPGRESTVELVSLAVELAAKAEPVVLFDPQADELVGSVSEMLDRYRRTADAALAYIASPEFQAQLATQIGDDSART